MAIRVQCTSCDYKFRVEDKYQNEQIACPSCSHEIVCGGDHAPDYDVFISYSNRDKETADAICAAIESRGSARCWMAPRDIEVAEVWAEAIVRALNQCRVLVVVFSESSNSSGHVLREITIAVSRGAVIVPFRIDAAEMAPQFEYHLCVSQWLDAVTKPLDGHLKTLIRRTNFELEKSGVLPWREPGRTDEPVRVEAPKPSVTADPLYEHARQLEDTERFDAIVRSGNLQTAMTAWLDLIGKIERAPGGEAHLAARGAEQYYFPILRHLVPAIERSTVPGTLYPLTQQLFQHLSKFTPEQRIALFENVGELLGPDTGNRLSGKARGLTALVQAYTEFDRSDLGYEIGARVVHRYPEAFLLAHMTAAAAQMASGGRAELLSEAIRIERMAQSAPTASTDPNYGPSSSVLAQSLCGLARVRRREGKESEAKTLLEQSIEKFEECLRASRPPLRLALYAEALRDAGRADEAFAAAHESSEKNWFLREAQSLVVELGQDDSKSKRNLPEIEKHCRYWSVVLGEWPGSAAERKWSGMYIRYLIGRKLYPEAIARIAPTDPVVPDHIREICRMTHKTGIDATIQIGSHSVRCTLDTWSPNADTPWFVVGLPEVGVFGNGADFNSATAYLGAFLDILAKRIHRADQITPKLKHVQSWFTQHAR